ncbi:MAG: potassium transporter Kup [Thermodesulfobacteriota bacterium]
MSHQTDKLSFQNKLLVISALGVVFGDIGTSPLYAFRECFSDRYGIVLNVSNVIGVLSLIIWSLIVVISIKYALFILRANSKGEGGILPLLTLVISKISGNRSKYLLSLGIFGGALFLADAIITPAISILSAVEGLKLVTPIFTPYIIPISVLIVIALFLLQTKGSGTIGILFGPIMLIWFLVLAFIGLFWIIKEPLTLKSFNPVEAFIFFKNNKFPGFLVLGGVFLVVTGGEALYADMGHFGEKTIRYAWFLVVFPSLILNYLGQGSLLILKPDAIKNTFYFLAPNGFLIPLVILSTISTIIASQAVISGVFSLASQAIHLDYIPRLFVKHTSYNNIGQVYVPTINWVLLICVLFMIIIFQESSNLASAYGAAVSCMMVVTTILLSFYMIEQHWFNKYLIIAITVIFLLVDITFFSANLSKIYQGGWIPIFISFTLYFFVKTWLLGRNKIKELRDKVSISEPEFVESMKKNPPIRVPGTAVFLTMSKDSIPLNLLHNIKNNKILHSKIILLTIITEDISKIDADKKLEISEIAENFYRITAHYGFMERPRVLKILKYANQKGLIINLADTTFFLGSDTLTLKKTSGIKMLKKRIFLFMYRNTYPPSQHFGIPPNKTVVLGSQVEI